MSAASTSPEYEIASQVESPKASKWVWRSFFKSYLWLFASVITSGVVTFNLTANPPITTVNWIVVMFVWMIPMVYVFVAIRRIRRDVRSMLTGQKDAIWKIGEEGLELVQASGSKRLAWWQVYTAMLGRHGAKLLTTEGTLLLLHPNWSQTPHCSKFIQMMRKHKIPFDIKSSRLYFEKKHGV